MNAFSPPGAESTSAALRRVEQERDDWIRAHDRVVETCVRVGKERDEAARCAADLEQVREELDPMRIRAESEAELSGSLIGEKQELINEKLLLKAKLRAARYHVSEADESEESALDRAKSAIRERDLARAELSSAHQELDALRTVRDRLDAALDHTRQQLGDAVNELMDWGVFGIPGASNPPEGASPA